MFDIKLQSEYDDLDKYEYNNGNGINIYYCKKGTRMLHNPYGPAYICNNGYKEYIVNNNLHRLDGPAKIYANGKEEYWINHKQLSKEEFEIHPEKLKFLGKEHLICLG